MPPSRANGDTQWLMLYEYGKAKSSGIAQEGFSHAR
jgi:hypothetical protein